MSRHRPRPRGCGPISIPAAWRYRVLWSASTDNVTPQAAIVYHIYVNGVLDNSAVGTTSSFIIGVAGENVISVIAVDAAGNRSEAGTFNIFIPT